MTELVFEVDAAPVKPRWVPVPGAHAFGPAARRAEAGEGAGRPPASRPVARATVGLLSHMGAIAAVARRAHEEAGGAGPRPALPTGQRVLTPEEEAEARETKMIRMTKVRGARARARVRSLCDGRVQVGNVLGGRYRVSGTLGKGVYGARARAARARALRGGGH